MKTLLIDNHDSFTYNLFQLLAEVNGEEPHVVRNDDLGWPELARRRFDNVVISPGPGRPDRAADFGVCSDAIAAVAVPLLGVCLGLQGISWLCGGRIVPAPAPVHGGAGLVRHEGSELFAGIPREFEAVRYHSLAVDLPLPDELEPLAWADDGVLMAVAHRTRPLWGVQFHPESIRTEHGRRLIENFRDLTIARRVSRPSRSVGASRAAGAAAGASADSAPSTDPAPSADPGPRADRTPESGAPASPAPEGGRLDLHVERLDRLVDPDRAFVALHADAPNAFWLDGGGDARSRFSFVGSDEGPRGALVTYDVDARAVTVERDGRLEVHHETVLELLARELARLRVAGGDDLPFALDCGFVGYLGYELKADCGAEAAHTSPLPDAALILADRLVAFDHAERCTYLLAVADAGGYGEARRWLDLTARRLSELGDADADGDDQAHTPAATSPSLSRSARSEAHDGPPSHARARDDGSAAEPRPRRTRAEYMADVERCQELLRAGESYEICLTNRIETDAPSDPLAVYRRLRRASPAPFSAFLRFGDVAVLSSSPERFLRVDRGGNVEAKPIKGTAARGSTPAEDDHAARALAASAKDRAENLMIVDLLRNDLGAVCAVGSVHVPELMAVETYAAVHQLVSTIRGRLRPDAAVTDCVRACFPPGSMTGAPKLRTMEILDGIEGGPRGVYSGAIGYLGLGGGCDLSVAIRTIVSDGERASVGAGGAVVVASQPEDEHSEMALKARAPLRALAPEVDVDGALRQEPVRPA